MNICLNLLKNPDIIGMLWCSGLTQSFTLGIPVFKRSYHFIFERKNMRKLALSDEILLSIEKPARYIGNEVNSVMKDKEQVDIRVAFCFPDVYEIGMSHLGIQILYDMFNQRDDIWCERVYSPWTDLDKVMREKHIPLFALESQDPVKEFDFLCFTIQYEMCYTNILQVLDLCWHSAACFRAYGGRPHRDRRRPLHL